MIFTKSYSFITQEFVGQPFKSAIEAIIEAQQRLLKKITGYSPTYFII